MSGVRSVSVVCVMAASFLWGNLVIDAWQKNQSNRAMAQLEAASSADEGDDAGLTVQQRADELAAAASAEFSKLIDGEGGTPSSGIIAAFNEPEGSPETDAAEQRVIAEASIPTPILKADADTILAAETILAADTVLAKVKDITNKKDALAVAKAEAAVRDAVETSLQIAALESPDKVLAEKTAAEMTAKTLVETVRDVAKPERWSVPVGVTPSYDETTAIRVGEMAWRVPTGVDPIYPDVVNRKLGKIAVRVSDKAVDATKHVSAKISSLASDVKKTIVKPEAWKVPDANTPVYDGQERLARSDTVWQVPTGNTPEYASLGDDKIGVPVLHHGRSDRLAVDDNANFAKDQRQLAYYNENDKSEPIEIVGKIVARLADEFEAPASAESVTFEKDDTRLSKDRVSVPVDKYAWKVPDAADPVYSLKGKSAVSADVKDPIILAEGPSLKEDVFSVSKGDVQSHDAPIEQTSETASEKSQLADQAAGKPEENMAPAKELAAVTDETAVARVKDESAVSTIARLAKNVEGDEAPIHTAGRMAALPTPAEEIEGGFEKSGSELRLSDDVPDRPADDQAAAAQRVAVWSVPDGATPEYGVVQQLERGLESVKAAAVDAGGEIAETVTALNSKVKGVVSSPEKWKVPTGVNWGEADAGETPDEDTLVADLPAEDNGAAVAALNKTLVDADSDAIEGDGKMQEVARDGSAKKDDEPEMFVSSQMAPVGEAPVTANNKSDEPVKVASRDEGDALSVVKSLKRMFDFLSEEESSDNEIVRPVEMSRADMVRFDALKTLMVDHIEYSATDAEKGEGQLIIEGRSQPDVRLSLYVDVQYIGDVQANSEGEWSLEKDIYLTRGQHLIRAEQMTDGGLMLARKAQPFAQAVAMKQPEGYEEPSVGIGLGDKALAVMRNKLKADNSQTMAFNSKAGLPSNGLMSPALQGIGGNVNDDAADGVKVAKSADAAAVVSNTPLPVLKPAELRLAESKAQHRLNDKAGVQHVAMLSKAEVARDSKSEKQVIATAAMEEAPEVAKVAEKTETKTKTKTVAETGTKTKTKADIKTVSKIETEAAPEIVSATEPEEAVGKAEDAKTADVAKAGDLASDSADKIVADDNDAKRGLAETKVAALSEAQAEARKPAADEKTVADEKAAADKKAAKDEKAAKGQSLPEKAKAPEKVAVKVADASEEIPSEPAVVEKAEDKKPEDTKPEVTESEVTRREVSEPKDTVAKADEIEVAALETDGDAGDDAKAAAAKSAEERADTGDKKIADAGPAQTTYTVKRGDTLAGIAKSLYGDAMRYKDILKLNPKLKSANLIYPKQKLKVHGDGDKVAGGEKAEPVKVAAVKAVKLPDSKNAEEKGAEKKAAAEQQEKAAAADKEAEGNKEFYVVKAGDSLWKIAQQVYGNGGRFKEIIDLNPALKKNPGLIRPKVKLRVKAA